LNDLRHGGEIDEEDFLNRADILCNLGQNVMISNYQEYYLLVDYLTGITRRRKMGIILGVYNLEQVFDESYYENLRGGILEAFGSLFGNHVKLFVYPSIRKGNKEVYSLDDFKTPKHLEHLYEYLKSNNKLIKIEGAKIDVLPIISDDILEMIKQGDSDWERYVPKKVEVFIKKKKLFGYKDSVVEHL
ncbi:MAG: TonB-dependent receptor, partial [Cyclobacteriaceae bacterium]|nr:TonB-dependent receptor [Cyclobacteriaceae bacterium]